MTQEEKQLLLADLCTRLPYGVFVNIEGFDYDFNGKLVQVYFGNINRCSIQVGSNISYSLEETKPWLRPMSSMTEEEKEELFILSTIGNTGVNTCWESYGVEIISTHPRYGDHYSTDYKVIDWLNKKMFDYRGLIEKRLAISTEEYNPYKS